MSRSLPVPVCLPLLAVAVGALLPAGALARPSLDFEAACYSEGDTMVFSGGGYTPSGNVNLFFSAPGRFGGTFDTKADPTGAISGRVDAPDPDGFMDSSQDETLVAVSANDRTRLDNGERSENSFGVDTFQLSRFGFTLRGTGDRPIGTRRPVRLKVMGYTGMNGKPAFMHYRRAGRTVKTVRLGTLRGPCGNLERTLPRAFPFRPVPAGSYKLVVNTSATNAAVAPWARMTFKVSRRDAVR